MLDELSEQTEASVSVDSPDSIGVYEYVGFEL
jgi:hypothetical protein